MNTLRELQSFVDRDRQLSSLRAELKQLTCVDRAHDLQHSLRVALWTCRIGGTRIDSRNAIAAALCHDVANHPKNSLKRLSASLESAQWSQAMLLRLGFESSAISEIAEAISEHSYSRSLRPKSALGQALQDADRLDALGAIGIIRTIATACELGTQFFDAIDPWAQERPLDDMSFALDHFFIKLLRLPESMCTDAGKQEAVRRVATMTAFLDGLADELGRPRPLF